MEDPGHRDDFRGDSTLRCSPRAISAATRGKPANLALELTDPGLVRVIADHAFKRRFIPLALLGVNRFQKAGAARDSVADLQLSVSVYPGSQSLPVTQGKWNRIHVVGGRYENDLLKDRRGHQIMINKGMDLPGIKDFEESARRIAPKIGANLVDFV